MLRGILHPVRMASLTEKARDTLVEDLELPVDLLEDVYGGKLVVALDRQHPRDLFDVMQLYAHEGIADGIRRAFVVYLACRNRPVHEVLFPALHGIRQEYERTFQGMTTAPASVSAPIETRERFIHELHERLDSNEREFLLSLVQNKPEWGLLGFKNLEELPGIRWRLRNPTRLARTDPKTFAAQADTLARLLG